MRVGVEFRAVRTPYRIVCAFAGGNSALEQIRRPLNLSLTGNIRLHRPLLRGLYVIFGHMAFREMSSASKRHQFDTFCRFEPARFGSALHLSSDCSRGCSREQWPRRLVAEFTSGVNVQVHFSSRARFMV